MSDLFVLNPKPPIIFAEASNRPDGRMFRMLLEIALKNPGLDFWKEMASKETQAKGKRGREVKLILPDSYEDSSDEELDSDLEDELSYDAASADLGELDDGQQPANGGWDNANVLSSSTGTASARNADSQSVLSFPGESSSFLTFTQGGPNPQTGSKRKFEQTPLDTGSRRPTVMRRGQLSPSSGHPPSSQLVNAHRNSNATERVPKIEGEEDSKSVFSLNLRTALERVLRGENDAHGILAIFHDLVSLKNKSESEQIRTWLMNREFKPRLVHIPANNQTIVSNIVQSQGTNDDATQAREIGDIQGVQRKHHLESVSDSRVLRQVILSLGRLYLSVRHFAMEGLVELITAKLQVSWNSYPGISQLGPVLDVAAMAFSGGPARKDALRTWIVSFIADTQDLYFYDCAPRFWEVMRGNAVLHDEVSQKRTEMHRDHPERYADVRALLRARGIENC